MSILRNFTIKETGSGYHILFSAMASSCEVLVDIPNINECKIQREKLNELATVITNEVWRIEDKYSRYNTQGVCYQINESKGNKVLIDHETCLLLNFADVCFELSHGLFDITSGVLRKVWAFDCSDNIPSEKQIQEALPYVGWNKVTFDEHCIVLPKGMEIDFGGIGKEYAVDRCILLIQALTQSPVLVNLGGDLAVTKPREQNKPWVIGVEHPGFENKTDMVVTLYKGALATSGNAKRYLLKNGIRYSHVLNAKTGESVVNAPRSITVSAEQCVQAGILATLSLLQGDNAEVFLDEQNVTYWAVK